MVRASFVDKFRLIAAKRIAAMGSDPASEKAKHELHTLKGEAQLVGFRAVSTLAREIERRVEQGALARARAGIELLLELVAMAPEDPIAMEKAQAAVEVEKSVVN